MSIKCTSKVPRQTFATTLETQQEQLKTDELMLRYAVSREQHAADPYLPAYHFVNPEGPMNDPNGLCHWQERYHLFYQTKPPEDPREHWGHTISDDLVHWKDLPLAIHPGIEAACFSGSSLVEEDRVIAIYHGLKTGNMVAVSSDPLLLNWEKIPGNPVIPIVEVDETQRPYRVFDPCIWKEDDGYYALSGTYLDGAIRHDCRMAQHLFFSQDLKSWTYTGEFVEGDVFTGRGEDGAVPYFWPIGDKHILLFASHTRGAQYLLGDYEKARQKFKPFAHGRFNFGCIHSGAVHAPCGTPDGEGGVYLICNINDARPTEGWNHLMSLVRLLTLREDNTLGIEPVRTVEALRSEHERLGETSLPANREVVLEGVQGNTMELAVEVDPRSAREICLHVLRSPGGEETTEVKFFRRGYMRTHKEDGKHHQDALVIDTSRSSLLPDVKARPPEIAPFELPSNETLKLRIFLDRSVVEVFANGTQCLALRVYPERRDSVGVAIRAQGGDAVLHSLDAWQMNSIYKQTADDGRQTA